MFRDAFAFNQDLSGWDVSKVESFLLFLSGATLTPKNYNQLLIQWSRLPLQSTLAFHGGKSKHDDGTPWKCRERLRIIFNWTITDGGSTGNQYPMPCTVFSVR